MRKYIFLVFFNLISVFTYCQSWTYESNTNEFDGKYKVASVIGSGGEFPYTSPLFVINFFSNSGKPNIYFSNAGYSGCDNKKAYIKFDGDNKIYSTSMSANTDNDAWFISDTEFAENPISKDELLEKIKLHSIMHVRLYSDCGEKDYKFSLNGSTKAINFVAGEYLAKIKEAKLKRLKEDEEKNMYLEKLKSGILLNAKLNNSAFIYYGVDYSKILKQNLKKDDEVVISNYSPNKMYCVLHNATSINLPIDTVYYIGTFSIDFNSIKEIEVKKE